MVMVPDAITLGRTRHLLPSQTLRQVKCILLYSINPDSRHDSLLYHDLPLRTLKHFPTYTRILPLSILSYDQHIDVPRLHICQRALHTRHKLARPKIDILIKLPSEQEQRTPERYVIRNDIRHPHSTEEDCVKGRQYLLPVVWKHLAMLEIIIARREVEVGELYFKVEEFGSAQEGADTFWRDFMTDSVTGDYGDVVGLHAEVDRR